MTGLDKKKLKRVAYHVMSEALLEAYKVEAKGKPVEMASLLEHYDPFSQDEIDYILLLIEEKVAEFEKAAR